MKIFNYQFSIFIQDPIDEDPKGLVIEELKIDCKLQNCKLKIGNGL